MDEMYLDNYQSIDEYMDIYYRIYYKYINMTNMELNKLKNNIINRIDHITYVIFNNYYIEYSFWKYVNNYISTYNNEDFELNNYRKMIKYFKKISKLSNILDILNVI